jgi:hypothetical protein
MLPKLTENKQEITAKTLEAAGHALLLLPVSKSLPDVPGSAELKAVMKRRDLKTDALAKSPVAVQLPGGTLAVSHAQGRRQHLRDPRAGAQGAGPVAGRASEGR